MIYFNHGIEHQIHDPFIQHLHYKADDFENFLKFFLEIGFEFISMDQLMVISKNRFRYKKPWIHLTFDDGYMNNKTIILPIIEKYNVPVTIFISTRQIQEQERFHTYKIKCALKFTKQAVTTHELFLYNAENHAVLPSDNYTIQAIINVYKYLDTDQRNSFNAIINNLLSTEEWSYYNSRYQSDQPLSVNDLNQLASHPLVHIGSHGVNHLLFSTLSESEMRYEFEVSKKWLEDVCKKEITTFCYPNGTTKDFNALSRKFCGESGYQMAFTTVTDFPDELTDLMEIPRIFMVPHNYNKDLKMILKKAFKLN